MNAAWSSTPDGRMSRATQIWSNASPASSAKRVKAEPMRRARSASSWSGTVPRMSYALKMASRPGIGRTLLDHFVGSAPSKPADARQVGDQAQAVAHDVHRRAGGVRHLHGDLGDGEPVALDQVQHLDVERKAVDLGVAEDLL